MRLSKTAVLLGGLLTISGSTVVVSSVSAQDDTVAPTVKCSLRKNLLWPPNHKVVNAGLEIDASDDGEVAPMRKRKAPSKVAAGLSVQVNVFADEDDEEPTGDGRHSPDARPGHSFTVSPGTEQSLWLRRERKGNGDGRVYLIVVMARDAAGNVSQDCCTAVIPRNNSKRARQSVARQAAAAAAFYNETRELPSGFVPVGDGAILGPKK